MENVTTPFPITPPAGLHDPMLAFAILIACIMLMIMIMTSVAHCCDDDDESRRRRTGASPRYSAPPPCAYRGGIEGMAREAIALAVGAPPVRFQSLVGRQPLRHRACVTFTPDELRLTGVHAGRDAKLADLAVKAAIAVGDGVYSDVLFRWETTGTSAWSSSEPDDEALDCYLEFHTKPTPSIATPKLQPVK